jgi:hypothetical protein
MKKEEINTKIKDIARLNLENIGFESLDDKKNEILNILGQFEQIMEIENKHSNTKLPKLN